MRKINLLVGLTLSFVINALAADVTDYTLTPQSRNQVSPTFVETDLSQAVTQFDYDCALTNIGVRASRDSCIREDDSLSIWVRVYNVGSEVVDSAQLLFTLDSVTFDSLLISGLYPGGSVKATATTIAPPACEAYIIGAHLHWPLDENPDNDQIEDSFQTAQEADTSLVHDDGFANSWSWMGGYEYPDYAMAARYEMPFDGVIKHWKWYYNQIRGYPRGNVELFVWEADTAGYPLDWGFGGLYDMEFQVPYAEFPDYAFVCYPMCMPVRERERYFFGYSSRDGTIQYFCFDDRQDNPNWNWWKADGVWYPDNLYDGDFMVHVYMDRAGVMMRCENFTPTFCRGKHFYFRLIVTNYSGGDISGALNFVGYADYDCSPANTLITVTRNRTYPTGYTGTNYFFSVPNVVGPGEYSVSVGGNLSGHEFFCCMNTQIVQCEPWRMGNNAGWQLVEVGRPEVALPKVTELHQNYPNPFNAVTNISYSLGEAGNVSLRVYDITGRLVATLVDEPQEAGEHTVTWDASGISSGVYFCKLKTGHFGCVKKLNLLK